MFSLQKIELLMESLQSGQESQVLSLKSLICTIEKLELEHVTEAEFHRVTGRIQRREGRKAGRQ